MKQPRLFLSLIALACLADAAEPSWWQSDGVKDDTLIPSDYAAINQGQLKNLANAARNYLELNLEGGAGNEVNLLVTSWAIPKPTTSDYSTVNLGQLKAVARPFYDRLIATGNATSYPWTSSPSIQSDYALVNIGQAKFVFSFVVTQGMLEGDTYTGVDAISSYAPQIDGIDSDHDGVPDWIEIAAGTMNQDPNSVPAAKMLALLRSRLSIFMTSDLAITLARNSQE